MEDDKIQLMCWCSLLSMLVFAMIGYSDGAICPAACRCDSDILKTSCLSASLEFVPIQLNPELHELDLSNNKIIYIHFSFLFYEKLVNLNLSKNRIKTLGNFNFEYQINLTHLDLSSNQIENLGKDSLKGLKALTHFDLSNNTLEEINSVVFRELYSLSVLKLCGNRLNYLEKGLFRAAKNLRELHINDNKFLEVPTATLVDTVYLRYLSLSCNLILFVDEGDVPNLPQLHTLLLDRNVLNDIHPAGLSSLLTLDHLDLSDNNLTSMPTSSLAKLSRLNTLRLSGNFITHILPVAFRGLFHLRILKIDRLESLKEVDVRAFVDNINLEKVYMDYNVGIFKLPTRLFHGNPKVRYISIRYNKLQTLDATHFPLEQLNALKIGGNPLRCNCSLGWLWQLIQVYKLKSNLNETLPETKKTNIKYFNLTVDEEGIACYGPEDLDGKLLASASKHQMDCTMGWMAAVSVAVTVGFILVVIGGVGYWAPKRRSRTNTKDLLVKGTLRNLPPPIHPIKSDSSWDPFAVGKVNIYEQLNDNGERPQIVYV